MPWRILKFLKDVGVVTNADQEDISEDALIRSRNARPELGIIKKTFGAGALLDSGSEICPITVATGYSVINICCYINENLPDGKAYIAIIQKDPTPPDPGGQVWIVQFDSDYNVASGEPSILLPFGADSFWVKGVAQTFNTYGKLMLTNVSVTGNDSSNSYSFPATSTFHMPNAIDDTDTTALPKTIAYGDFPSELGHSMYEADDVEYAGFSDTVAFDNETIKTFQTSTPRFEIGVMRFAEANGYVFAITRGKDNASAPDKLWWYNSAWVEISFNDYGVVSAVADTLDASDQLVLYNITAMDDDLYLTYRHYDNSDTGAEYHYRMYRLTSIGSSNTWSEVWSEDLAADIVANVTGYPQDCVTTSISLIGGTNYLIVCINGQSTTTTCPGYLLAYDTASDTTVELTKPDLPSGGATVNVVGIAESDSFIAMLTNDTTNTNIEAYYSPDILEPSWGTLALPATLRTIGSVTVWESAKFIVTTNKATTIGFVAKISDSVPDSYWVLIEVDLSAVTFTDSATYKYDAVTYNIHSLYFSSQADRTGSHYISSRVEIAGALISHVIIANDSLVASTFYKFTANHRVLALLSYEVTLDHITSIHYLMGDYDPAITADPIIKRIVSFGANPDHAAYASAIEYNASFGACMGWIELFQSLDTDLEIDLYHKEAQNPIVLDRGVLRVYGGALATDDGTPSGNEVKNLWYGWIDRDYYDELYSTTPGWWVMGRHPDTPLGYPNTDLDTQKSGLLVIGEKYLIKEVISTDDFSNVGASGAAGVTGEVFEATGTTPTIWTNFSPLLLQEEAVDLQLSGWGPESLRYLRYAFIYDGVQESLLSPVVFTEIDDGVDRASFRMKLYDTVSTSIRSNSRITGMNMYSMTGSGDRASATLIQSFSFIIKKTDRPLFSENGKTGLYVWLDTTTPPVLNNYIANGDVTALYRKMIEVTALDQGYLVKTDAPTTPAPLASWDAQYFLSATGLTGSGGAGIGSGFYGGKRILIDTTVDFRGLNPMGLAVAAVKSDGQQVFSPTTVFGAETELTMTVNNIARHAVQIEGEYVSTVDEIADFNYDLGTHPSVFYTIAGVYYMFGIINFATASLNGATYGLQGEVSINVNSDYAKIIGNRTWQAYSILDPAGKAEEQLAAVNYSEAGQLDVMPVSNIIFINDREGGGCTGVEDLFNLPVVATQQGIFRINAAFGFNESAHNIGNLAKHGMISAMGKVYVCWENGIYALSVNNLAASDDTPTERLKVSLAIEDTYLALTRAKKEAIQSKFDQSKGEIVFTLDTEVWAFNPTTNAWREIDSTHDFDMVEIDENADLMAFDTATQKFYTVAQKESLKMDFITKWFSLDDEIAQGLRYLQIRYKSPSATNELKIAILGNGDTTNILKTIALVAKTSVYTLPLEEIRRYATSYAIRVYENVAANEDVEIYKISVEEAD